MKSTPRTRKIGEAIKEATAAILLEEIADPRIDLVTVTSVEVSSDLGLANIYVVTHGESDRQEALIAGLDSAKNRIRSSLGKRVAMRVVPELRFKIDPSVEQGMRISKALKDEAERRPVSSDEE
ncbi:MAG: 30S ribosome-binding factor RbfA [Coriobacteriia bacterium]|nr:30S ribosome-binding factor RbfA [Coriobacteriia bacterium]